MTSTLETGPERFDPAQAHVGAKDHGAAPHLARAPHGLLGAPARPGPTRLPAALHAPSSQDVDDETAVSRWFVDWVAAGRGRFALPLRAPRRTAAMLRLVRRLPRIPVRAAGTPDNREIRAILALPPLPRLLLGHAVSALPVPADAKAYLTGRPKHALRQKVRAAAEAGLRYRTVADQRERADLVALADEHERTTAVASTRNSAASNLHLLPLEHWLVAESVEGEPLLLAVVAVDGEIALLRYYRTLAADERASLARYGAMPHLVESLRAQGVRVLLEAGRPYWTDNLIRQFQRKLGFRLVRVQLERPGR